MLLRNDISNETTKKQDPLRSQGRLRRQDMKALLPHAALTESILECCGFLEAVYKNALLVEVKCCKCLLSEHQAQTINYLAAAKLPASYLQVTCRVVSEFWAEELGI